MTTQSPQTKATHLIQSLEAHGQDDYIGESISQLEHCLQAAHQAQKSGARNDLILAALLHDIGQIIPLDARHETRMNIQNSNSNSSSKGENVGRVGHESIGGEYLRSLGFSRGVCRLVESHVAAKRYLTAVDHSYYESLSAASKKSLEFQGGPFTGGELAAFDQDPLRDEMVALRLWDDAAKVPGIEDSTPRAREYSMLIVEHLERQEIAD
ncbi:hypothetical protein P170DRAFT_473037 [Aspergillus steynii IBT 23096]|uniref:HD domain-containing protein n=1 Tax=Aspergillus steynii IBT 23096 TaxID=1392250 RepID=A0A2I2GJV4_9EURO|nr:uncharacterized protein P170DRAFT_473037 [Aspergillus steynii IBT 23096]PLB53161.1 hypothetical protein P170DRAFT_473037 [Aspergillus steynii IBT 23096]